MAVSEITNIRYKWLIEKRNKDMKSFRVGAEDMIKYSSEKCMEEDTTQKGNPRKPQGKEGAEMLKRMNESHSRVTVWALEFFDFKENDQILDIGCGGGAALRRMSENIRSGHLTGVDYSPVSVKLSQELNEPDILNGKMEIIEASVEHLPFEDEKFDKIITVESFYFWPEPVNNLTEVLRILKKNGVFLLVADIYNKDSLGEQALENIEKYQLFNPTPDEFQEMFKKAGFSGVKIHTKTGEDWICVEGIR